MHAKPISVAGANTLLGQHLLSRLLRDPGIEIASLHDHLANRGALKIGESQQWHVDPDVADGLSDVPFLAPDAPALAPLLLSFLPDEGADVIEAAHLARGTRVITHCEYARLTVPLVLPGMKPVDKAATHLATPNCTTAICAPVLQTLQAAHGVMGVTITALQAISGTDLPGMPAHAIHDHVVGHLDGEARALSAELGVLFDDAFAVDVFATRVPVWRGHTITLAVTLRDTANAATALATLKAAPGVSIRSGFQGRDRFAPDESVAMIADVRDGARGVLLVIKGDNLEMATTGLMHQVLTEVCG